MYKFTLPSPREVCDTWPVLMRNYTGLNSVFLIPYRFPYQDRRVQCSGRKRVGCRSFFMIIALCEM